MALDAAFAPISGSYFVTCRPADDKLSKNARDDEAARRLWEASEELIALS